jgi:hypothetical protein
MSKAITTHSQVGVAGDHAHIEGGVHFYSVPPPTNPTERRNRAATLHDVATDFVNRKKARDKFLQMLKGKTDGRILLILEPAEMGKTYLIRRLLHECWQQKPPVFTVHLDFDQRRSGLTDYFSVGHTVREFLGDEHTRAICDCEKTLPTAERDAQMKKLGQALCDDLADLAKTDRRVVLFLDTFENVPKETSTWLERWLFKPLRELSHVILVVGSDPKCEFFAQPRPWSNLIARIHFGPMDDVDILEYYQTRGLAISDGEAALLQIARMNPAQMAQLGDLLEQSKGGVR